MAHKITDECTNCATCVDYCPSDAIAGADSKHNIDADICVDCGACVDACPVNAICA